MLAAILRDVYFLFCHHLSTSLSFVIFEYRQKHLAIFAVGEMIKLGTNDEQTGSSQWLLFCRSLFFIAESTLLCSTSTSMRHRRLKSSLLFSGRQQRCCRAFDSVLLLMPLKHATSSFIRSHFILFFFFFTRCRLVWFRCTTPIRFVTIFFWFLLLLFPHLVTVDL